MSDRDIAILWGDSLMRRTLAFTGIVGVALILAFPLRDAVYGAVIVPVAYVLWVLGLVYHSLHQLFWWVVVTALVVVIIARSLSSEAKPAEWKPIKSKPIAGQVETLAGWMKKSERGRYFKWSVANRLGKIAYQLLSQRETGKARSVFDPLAGSDWNPGDGLQSYLETGLCGSFTDFPRENRPFSQPSKTPLDHDVNDAVAFLESQIGNK